LSKDRFQIGGPVSISNRKKLLWINLKRRLSNFGLKKPLKIKVAISQNIPVFAMGNQNVSQGLQKSL